MSDLALTLSAPPAANPKTCAFKKWVLTLDAEDQKAVEAALRDIRWTNRKLLNEFVGAGLGVGQTVLRDHRVGECACDKS